MKVVILGDRNRCERYQPQSEWVEQCEKVYLSMHATNEEILAVGKDADMILVDAIGKVDRQLMEAMPNLKLVHSEGVAYNGIDVEAARELGILVCNNKGVNAGAVAEQAILLMLALLRTLSPGRQAELAGHQIDMKHERMLKGIRELGECRVGLVGMGDIAKATAKRLSVFGCQVFYYNRTRKSPELEAEYQVTYLPLEELCETCDIVSLHVAVTPETTNMVNETFLKHMKSDAYLINTARGELVDNEALRTALIQGQIAGAGLDTIAPEPTPSDHPLVELPEEASMRVEYSPHLGGITTGTFKRIYQNVWENAKRLEDGQSLMNVVNGL